MTKRYHTLGRNSDINHQAEMLDGYSYLLALIEDKRHSDLIAYLSRLRMQGSQAADPLIQNLLESMYHLCMAWIHSLGGDYAPERCRPEDRDRQDMLEDQLRSLCLSIRDIAAKPKIPFERAGEPKEAGLLAGFIYALISYFSKEKEAATVASTSLAFAAPSIELPNAEKIVERPTSAVRDRHGRAPDGRSSRAEQSGFMSFYFFGSFRVCINGEFIKEWRNAKSKMIFKYLVAHKRCSIAKECLMELFWPNNDPECARNNLNVAIYNIRQALKQHGDGLHAIIYSDGHYGISPEFRIWTDFEAFDHVFDRAQLHESEGDLDQQMSTLNELDELYGGDFLEEDRFEAWIMPLRQKYQDLYKTAIDKRAELYFEKRHYDRSIDMYKKINMIDPCDEQAHRRRMTCHARLGQNHLAMRQFNSCVEALARDLDLAPDERTVDLFERIRRRESV